VKGARKEKRAKRKGEREGRGQKSGLRQKKLKAEC